MKLEPELISRREFARRDGCSEKLVREAVKSGALPQLPDLLLPSKLVRTAWRAGNVKRLDVADPLAQSPAESAPGVSLTEARRIREITLANLRRHELDTRSAQWVLRDDAVEVWVETVRITRENFSGLPADASVMAAGCGTMAAIQVAVHDAVYAALLSASRVKSKRREPKADIAQVPIPSTATTIQAETAKIVAIGQLHQLDLDIAQGGVIGVSPLLRSISELLARVRQRMLSLEAVLPPRLIGLDQRAAEKVIQAAIDEALEDLAEQLPELGGHAEEESPINDTPDRHADRNESGSRSPSKGREDSGCQPGPIRQRRGSRAR